MKYVSTRGRAPVLAFDDALLAGLAVDGGLYVPETWPRLDAGRLRALAGRPYVEVATEVVWPFVEGGLDRDVLAGVLADAYATFDAPEVCPLTDLGDQAVAFSVFNDTGSTQGYLRQVVMQQENYLFITVIITVPP